MKVLMTENKSSLIKGMEERFNGEEFVVLCSDLGIKPESLSNGNMTTKILSLVDYCLRTEIIDRLIAIIRMHRPQFDWTPVFENSNTNALVNTKTDNSTPAIVYLNRNPLEACIPFIQDLINKLNDVKISLKNDDKAENYILDCIQKIYSAHLVLTLNLKNGEASTISCCSNSDKADIDDAIRSINALNSSAKKNIIKKGTNTLVNSSKSSIGNLYIVSLVPLKNHAEYLPIPEFLLIAGVPNDSVYLGDAFAIVLNAMYFATNKLSSVSPLKIEGAILDALKMSYLSLPSSLEETRLRLIRTQLNQLTFHFQPIIRLHPKDIYISSWEALVRDTDLLTDTAPRDLLSSIELWGESFSAVFDSYVLRNAVETYRAKLRGIKGMRRSEDLKDLSVNVYPQSLEQPEYYDTVKDILDNGIIPCEKLILELSERSTFSGPSHDVSNEGSVQKIRRSIEKFAQHFQIEFSIDDFGSGQNQLDKLNLLPVKYLKVDRSVLFERHAKETLEFILKTATRSSLIVPKVIVEGFEEGVGQKLTLSELYGLGVRYIQCFLSGMPKDTPYRLDRDTIGKLRNDISVE